MQYLKLLLASSMTILLLAACGGDSGGGAGGGGPGYTSYSGNTSEASLDSSKSAAYTKATATAMEKEQNSDSIPRLKSSVSNKMLAVQSKTTDIIRMHELVPNVCSSGTVDVTGGETSGTITYSNCVVGTGIDTVTVNGRVTYTFTNDTDSTISYTNFTISFDGTTETIENMTISCSGGACTISSDFTGTDGVVYRAADFSITGMNPYDISVRIYHSSYGYVDITGNVTLGTCGLVERPISGSITITGSNVTAVITYTGCDSFSININGTVTTGTW